MSGVLLVLPGRRQGAPRVGVEETQNSLIRPMQLVLQGEDVQGIDGEASSGLGASVGGGHHPLHLLLAGSDQESTGFEGPGLPGTPLDR